MQTENRLWTQQGKESVGCITRVTLKHTLSHIAQLVKNLPAMQETPVRFLGQDDPLEKG